MNVRIRRWSQVRPGSAIRVVARATCSVVPLLAMAALGSCAPQDPAARLAARSPVWGAVAGMASARDYHTATLLPSGKVLVAGGVGAGGGLSSAELYDPATGTWSPTGSLATTRYYHTATLLRTGKVLVVGGCASTFLATAELYDPTTGRWTATGGLAESRSDHTATLLPSGKVLVTGGTGLTSPSSVGYRSSAEIYDPATGTWSAAGSLADARAHHTATLLSSGKVLVAGGSYASSPTTTGYLPTAELYDPATGTWSATGPLADARENHTATLLPSGQVLVAGGVADSSPLSSAELYDPGTETWSTMGPLVAARESHAATLLPSGKVLVSGGYNWTGILASAETYDTATATWSSTSSLATARERHTATLLPSGKVLVVGGFGPTPSGPTTYGRLASAELHDPSMGTWSTTGSLADQRDHHTATLLSSGTVLVAGGYDGASFVSSAELYDPATATWSSTGSLAKARERHTATLLPSGKVLVAGGYGSTGPSMNGTLASAELYDLATGTWSETGSLKTARQRHTATLLPSGEVLVVGGGFSTAELYDPAAGTWSATGSLATARSGVTATLLPSGKVLVVGGYGAISPGNYGWLKSAELYDPATGTWSATGSLATERERHTATLLPSGRVLVAGGTGTSGVVADAEIYDPATGAWSAAGSLAEARNDHAATLLPSGSVLVSGGYGASGRLASAELFDPATGEWSSTASLATARDVHTGTLLPSGQVLVVAGYSNGSVASAELFDEGRGAQAAWTPKITGGSRGVTAGGYVTLDGTLLTGISEGSCGGTQSSPANAPVVQLQASDGALTNLVPTSWSDVSLSVTVPPAVANGIHWVRAIVSGVPSRAWPLTVVPALVPSPKTLVAFPRATFTFTASGGSGTGYTWSFETNASGGTLNATTGAYTAGSTGSVIDVLRVTDSLGLTATANAFVGAGLSLSPSQATLAPMASRTFTASGGSGQYTWSLPTNASGGSIVSSAPTSPECVTGAYTAGATSNVVDVVQVVDTYGNIATATVTVSDPLAIAPASATVAPRGSQAFAASGGSGTGYTWSLATNGSGGAIDASTGAYVAGATGDATDVVEVTDSLGNAATASVTVTAGVSITEGDVTVAAGGSQTFTASGGSGTYTWSLATNASGATIDPSTGAYTAGPNGGTDVVQVTDSLGNVATVNVTVTPNPANGGDSGGGGGGCGCGSGGGSSFALLVLGVLSLSRARSRCGRHELDPSQPTPADTRHDHLSVFGRIARHRDRRFLQSLRLCGDRGQALLQGVGWRSWR